VLSLATEDAFALWEVAHEVGGDLTVAANVVKNLLRLGLVVLGIEDWTDAGPAFVVDGKYVEVPFTGDADALLANPAAWQSNNAGKYVVWATPAGHACYFAPQG
jgi:predicted transcriptional regulator